MARPPGPDGVSYPRSVAAPASDRVTGFAHRDCMVAFVEARPVHGPSGAARVDAPHPT